MIWMNEEKQKFAKMPDDKLFSGMKLKKLRKNLRILLIPKIEKLKINENGLICKAVKSRESIMH